MSYSGYKHPSIQILEQHASQFNSEYGGVPAYGLNIIFKKKKKKRMKKIHRGWKALQVRIDLGYDPSTDRVICLDDAWQSFIQVIALSNICPANLII